MTTRLELAKLTMELAATDLESEKVQLRLEIKELVTEAVQELYAKAPYIENAETGERYRSLDTIKQCEPELYDTVYQELSEDLFKEADI